MLKHTLALALFALPSFGGAIFADSTFNLANYTNPFIYQFDTNGGSHTFSQTQCSSCGNPGQGLDLQVNVSTSTSSSAEVFIGLLNNSFVYNPSTQGAIVSIDAQIDNMTTESGIGPFFTMADTFVPLIEQDGNFYIDTIYVSAGTAPGLSTYQTISAVLTASSFYLFNTTTGALDTSQHPNFAGDPMQFGIVDPFEDIVLPAANWTVLSDNLSLTLNTAPEPSTFAILAAGLIALCALRRR